MSKFSQLGHALYTGRLSLDFVSKRRRVLWYTLSGLIVLVALSGLLFRGLNFGIEFEGGVEYKVSLPTSQVNEANVEKIRDAVANTGIPAASAPIVNTSGTDTIRVQTEPIPNNDVADRVSTVIQKSVDAKPGAISEQAVGATWGAQVAKRAVIGLVVFLVLVVLLIWAYFRQWKMSIAAIVALAHDVLITVGVYALSGFEVSPASVTGVLTILGFSLYDTVVVFDKVRENTRNLVRTRQTYGEAANLAINQTLVRSINTSLVALLPVGAILYVGAVSLGSGALKDLALALFVGMAAGAYSSIFIATPLLVQLKQREKSVSDADRRLQARRRRQVDRYAHVPAVDDSGEVGGPSGRSTGQGVAGGAAEATGAESDWDADDQGERVGTGRGPRREEPMGSGRVAPSSRGPVGRSASSKRSQPSRQPRSKRGKK